MCIRDRTPTEYARDLNRHLKRIHEGVAGYLSADYERKRHLLDKATADTWTPQPGDVVLLRKPPAAALRSHGDPDGVASVAKQKVSTRLQPLTAQTPFKVRKAIGDKSYILADPDTGSTDLGFSQPVALERLVSIRPSSARNTSQLQRAALD